MSGTEAGLRSSILALLVVLGASLGCGLFPERPPPGLEPKLADVPIAFAAPEMVTIRPGDTLAILGKRHHVSVEDLRGWNGLTTDTIEVGAVLLVWTQPEPEKPAKKAAPAVAPSIVAALEDVFTTTPAAPPPGTPDETLVLAAADPEPAPAAGDAAEVPAVPTQRITIERPVVFGMMGVQTGSDVDLADVAGGMEAHDVGNMGSTGLSGRDLQTGDQADGLVMKQRPTTNGGVQIPTTAVTSQHPAMPAAKQCLRGATATVSESGSVSSGGLTVGQINAGMGAISRYTVKCFPPGTKGSYSLVVEITAGCNGQVSNVYLVNAGVVPPNVTSCLQKTLSYAGFPAHSVPNGVSFQYPMKFTF